MARVLLTGVITFAQGHAGGVTFLTNAGGTTARARAARVKRTSIALVTCQSFKTKLCLIWNLSLTQIQRDAWDTFARTNQFRNSRNKLNVVPMAPTVHFGNNLFTALATNLKTLHRVNLPDPPGDLLVSDLLQITLSQLPGTLNFQLSHSGTIPDTDYIVISTSIQRPAGASAPRKSNQVQTHLWPGGTAQPFNLTPAWAAKWGPLRPNALVDVRACTIRSTNGARGPRYTANLVISP